MSRLDEWEGGECRAWLADSRYYLGYFGCINLRQAILIPLPVPQRLGCYLQLTELLGQGALGMRGNRSLLYLIVQGRF